MAGFELLPQTCSDRLLILLFDLYLVLALMPLVSVLAVIFIVTLAIIAYPPPFLLMVMVSTTCVHFSPEATERQVQKKQYV